MDDVHTRSLLALAELPGIGERRLAAVQDYAHQARVPLTELTRLPAATLRRVLHLPAAAVRRLCDEPRWHAARCAVVAERLAAAGASLCQPGDPWYPPGWTARARPMPPLATLYGDPALAQRPCLALLHSRLVGADTVTASLAATRAAAAAGVTIAVGGMKTPHRIAASAARALGAARLVVLDRGLLSAFGADLARDPFGLGPGRARFDPRRTLVLSAARPDDHAVPRSGRRRDALLAALGDAVMVLSARPGGEVERCALAALAAGQPVWVWEDANRALLAAGAVRHDGTTLADALTRWRPAPARRPG